MYFPDSPEEIDLNLESVFDQQIWSCSQGHRSTLFLQTQQGGVICLLCLSNLITTPRAPTVHVSYALSNLYIAVSLGHVPFHHARFLVSPLVLALSSFDDYPIACQLINLITTICNSDDGEIAAEFVNRVSDTLSSGELAWSRRQLYMLHCFGVLLNCQINNRDLHIKDKDALISNLVTGLELPSEEIQGEILFVLYKVSTLQRTSVDGDWADLLLAFCPKLFRLSLEALMKAQSDDVRLNCVAFLTIMAQKGFFIDAYANENSSMRSKDADNFTEVTESGVDQLALTVLFAEAIKGPLLSSDNQVQESTLDLIFHYLSRESSPGKQIKVFVEENIADYVFEILRLSEFKGSIVNSCLQVLNLFLKAGQTFRQRLVIGFSTLIPVLKHVAEVPFHPLQSQTLKLIWNCISVCPGILLSHVEEVILVLAKMLKRHGSGEMAMLPDTFAITCSIFVVLLKSPSFSRTSNLAASVQEASKHAVISCLSISEYDSNQILPSLCLLREAYAYSYEILINCKPSQMELRNWVMDICTKHILPWFITALNDIDEETVAGILETFQLILLQDSEIPATEFAKTLVSSSWFSLSFGCLGLFPTEKIKYQVYTVLSSLADVLLGSGIGQTIRDAALILPSDPVDLLFLLGQKSSQNLELSSCQSAVLLILNTAALYDDRLADEKVVLASLEQFILVNSSTFLQGASDLSTLMWLVNLYGLYRSLIRMSHEVLYSQETERIFFHILTEVEWDLPSARFHTLSLKWLFQQEKISEPLSFQILKYCRRRLNCTDVVQGKHSQTINEIVIAELVATGDNYGASLFACLLIQLIEQENQEDNIISVMIYLARAINIFPETSAQLCLNDIGKAIHALFYNPSYSSSLQTFKESCILMLTILSSVQTEVLSDDDAWVFVTLKLTDNLISTVAVVGWTGESLLATAVLSLILHLSTKQALVEASKTIVLNTSLTSIINNVIDTASSKGPALMDYDEGTSTGESLTYVLLLYYFSLRSLQAVFPGSADWQGFLDPSSKTQSISMIKTCCHNLCRLLYFGSSSVKLVSSYCLLELFSLSSDVISSELRELNCSVGSLMSIRAILEGLIFCSDIRVATNCGLCLSIILEWVKLDIQENRITGKNYWCRMIVEELAMSLAVPTLASNSFIDHHKPAIYVAAALLRLENVPRWMRTLFDGPCISAIIANFGARNISSGIVFLFRELLNSHFLNSEHIASLNHVLQACRKYMYTNKKQDEQSHNHTDKMLTATDDLGGICEYLIYLMSSQSFVDKDSGELLNEDKRLLEEIELFFRLQDSDARGCI